MSAKLKSNLLDNKLNDEVGWSFKTLTDNKENNGFDTAQPGLNRQADMNRDIFF